MNYRKYFLKFEKKVRSLRKEWKWKTKMWKEMGVDPGKGYAIWRHLNHILEIIEEIKNDPTVDIQIEKLEKELKILKEKRKEENDE